MRHYLRALCVVTGDAQQLQFASQQLLWSELGELCSGACRSVHTVHFDRQGVTEDGVWMLTAHGSGCGRLGQQALLRQTDC